MLPLLVASIFAAVATQSCGSDGAQMRGYVVGMVENLKDTASFPPDNWAAYSPASQDRRISVFAEKGMPVNPLSTKNHKGIIPEQNLVYGHKYCGKDKMTVINSVLGADKQSSMLTFGTAAKYEAMKTLGFKPDLLIGFCASEPTCGADAQMFHYKSDLWNSDVYAWTPEAKQKYESMSHFRLVDKLPCYLWDTKETCPA